MFERRLLALGYHNTTNFNPNDLKEFQSLILWLEEQHIRRYPIDSDQRNGLRQLSTDQWQIHYEKYLKDVECPFVDNNVQSVCWLLGYALRLDNEHGTETESGSSSGFMTNIDAESQEFKDGVEELSNLLQIPAHPNPQTRLEACCKLLKSQILGTKENSANSNNNSCMKIDLRDHDFGFTDKNMDPVLKEACKILRLLHLTNLRSLQNEINNTIELVQSATANPKTDTKLGKVGR